MKTLYDKLWDEHHIHSFDNGYSLIYIDRHLIHEVTSPQAFEGLKQAGRNIWSKKSIMAVPDHNVPTKMRENGIKDPISKIQVDALDKNCKNNNLLKFDLEDIRQGIVHVVGPEQGILLPGMTVVCGDSHTSTHGALAALAFGIGTSEVEHVLATQCLLQKKSQNMNINVVGEMPNYFYSKDLALLIISKIGTAGGTGFAIEYTGNAIRNLSIEARMTLCNMTIEAGATTGLIAVDEKTISYVNGKPYAPKEEEFKKYVSDDESLVVGDSNLGEFYNYTLDNLNQEALIDWDSFDIRDIDVHFSSDMTMAYLTFYADGAYTFKESGESVDYNTRASAVWIRTADGWKSIHANWAPTADGTGIPQQ